MIEDGCDNCGKPRVEQIIFGFKADGERWKFTLCRNCSVRLRSIDYEFADPTNEPGSDYTREELLEILRRSK